jgi:hypothetical protein
MELRAQRHSGAGPSRLDDPARIYFVLARRESDP